MIERWKNTHDILISDVASGKYTSQMYDAIARKLYFDFNNRKEYGDVSFLTSSSKGRVEVWVQFHPIKYTGKIFFHPDDLKMMREIVKVFGKYEKLLKPFFSEQ